MKAATQYGLISLTMALAACAHAPMASSASYAVTANVPMPGEGHWDLLAVDPGRHHVFVSRGDRVQVLDAASGRLAGTLAGTDGVHGVVVVPGLRRGYTTNGKSGSVTEFDLDSLQRLRDIPLTGKSPDAALFDTRSGRLFVFNAKSNNASVVDVQAGREIAVIPFDGNPELAAEDGAGHVFVNIEDKAQLDEIDTGTLKITRQWALAGCEEPSGLALDAAHARVFSVCQNQVMVVTDAGDGHQVARVPIGDGPDGAAFDPVAQMVFSPNGRSGTLTVVHEDDPDHFRVVQTLATQASARTIALDERSRRLFLPTARFAPQAAGQKGRPPMVPGSFSVLVVEPVASRR